MASCGETDMDVIRSEWPTSDDIQMLTLQGWKPEPFRQFIVKLHSRCNLACDYCYVYELADQRWQTRPKMMQPPLISAAASRIAEHASNHDLKSVRVIFHGGEPLLAGAYPVIGALKTIRAAVDKSVTVDSWVQTNGTLLSNEVLDALEAIDMRIGVSIDGEPTTHNQHRQHANSRGSYCEVAEALRLLMNRPQIYSGLLCVIDLSADPLRTYESLLNFRPPTIDFLLPHGNWSRLPPGRSDSGLTPYADWLVEIFDRWYSAPVRETSIRLFDEIIHLLLGGKSATETVGLTPSSLVVIETDGSIEQSDSLKSAYDGAAATGLHVSRDSFDAALRLPQIAATQLGMQALSDECLACSIRKICGAGLYAHRYRQGGGFRNRSVYCQDLYKLIIYIKTRLDSDFRTLQSRLSECSMKIYT